MVASPPHEVEKRDTITVMSLPLAERIARGKYDWTNEDLTENHLPHDPTSVGEWEWKLVHFGKRVSPKTAVAAVQVSSWTPATLEHLLSFGEKYPKEQRKYTIIALGSSIALGSLCVIYDGRFVPGLWSGDSKRFLNLFCWAAIGVVTLGFWRFAARSEVLKN